MNTHPSHPDRYAQRFQALEASDQKAFIPFTLLGWPNRETSLAMIESMIHNGASALELGLAFSDPMSDGPVIQEAAMETLAQGFSVDDALTLLKKVRTLDQEIPIGLLVYYNMVLARGIEAFFRDISDAGVDGVLIADLPPELASEVYPIAQRYHVNLIFIVSPLTSLERLSLIQRYAGGFLYIVSRLGITGTEENYDDELKAIIHRVKTHSTLPACVGFGVSSPQQAQRILGLGADGVITGSKIIQLVQSSQNGDFIPSLSQFLSQMVGATLNPLITP